MDCARPKAACLQRSRSRSRPRSPEVCGEASIAPASSPPLSLEQSSPVDILRLRFALSLSSLAIARGGTHHPRKHRAPRGRCGSHCSIAGREQRRRSVAPMRDIADRGNIPQRSSARSLGSDRAGRQFVRAWPPGYRGRAAYRRRTVVDVSRARRCECHHIAKGCCSLTNAMAYTGPCRPAALARVLKRPRGEVAEWSNAPHSKCGMGVTPSGVRIPPSPPLIAKKHFKSWIYRGPRLTALSRALSQHFGGLDFPWCGCKQLLNGRPMGRPVAQAARDAPAARRLRVLLACRGADRGRSALGQDLGPSDLVFAATCDLSGHRWQ